MLKENDHANISEALYTIEHIEQYLDTIATLDDLFQDSRPMMR